ncbi:hypothetical protein C8R45DRAFT_383169 [Mycena sanguinolenta]|nr:hypothetical protein C8R45DRAFT_383169 [Mycena sanguinolenta]
MPDPENEDHPGAEIAAIAGFTLPDTKAMAAALQTIPSFTEIAVAEVDECDPDNQHEILSTVVALFTISNSTPSSVIFPHITEIGFACQRADAVVFPLFLNMLESEWKARGCALESTELVCLGYPAQGLQPNPRSLARIEKLRQAGLRISLLFRQVAQDCVNGWLHLE